MGVALRRAARVREHSRRGDIEEFEIVCLFGGERLFEPTSASPAAADLARGSARECLYSMTCVPRSRTRSVR